MIRAFLALALLTTPAHAETITGRASVIDGDTIVINETRIRLNGIDAPESRQLCYNAANREYRCGQAAALALDAFLAARRPTACRIIDTDRYGRAVAVCSAAGADVAEWLVANGHALDWPRYSDGAYSAAQAAAKSARRGVWAGRFARPWEWRRDRGAGLIGANE